MVFSFFCREINMAALIDSTLNILILLLSEFDVRFQTKVGCLFQWLIFKYGSQ